MGKLASPLELQLAKSIRGLLDTIEQLRRLQADTQAERDLLEDLVRLDVKIRQIQGVQSDLEESLKKLAAVALS